MARIWAEGFEQNALTIAAGVSATSGSPVLATSPVHGGLNSLKIASLVSGTRKYAGFDILNGSSTLTLYYRIYIYIVTLPSADNRIIVLDNATTPSTPIVWITLSSTGTLQLSDEDGDIGSPSSALTTDAWHMIEIKSNKAPASGSEEVRARLNGVEFAAATDRTLSATTDCLVIGGNLNLEAQTQGEWYFDDLALNNTAGSFENSWPDEGYIINLRPNAAGDNADWTRGGADSGANWSQVDDFPPNDATDYVTSTTLNQIDDYNVEASGLTNETIKVILVGVRFGGAASANSAFTTRIKAASAGTVDENFINPNNSIYRVNTTGDGTEYPHDVYDLPGASTAAWTPADLDQMQIGVRLSTDNTGNINVSAIWALVEYVSSATTAVKDTIQSGIIPFAR